MDSALLIHRLHFAFTVTYHYLFPQLTMGLAPLILILKSSVNRVFHTSMEVGVRVHVENYIAGTTRHVSSAFLTFVAVDRDGRHLPVPPVVPESVEEKRRFEDAGRRREHRVAERNRGK